MIIKQNRNFFASRILCLIFVKLGEVSTDLCSVLYGEL